MDDQAVARVVDILETDPDFYVPVKKVLLTLQGEGLASGLDLRAFTALLAADNRFEFIDGIDYGEGFEDDPDAPSHMTQGMEARGFFSGPRVKLLSRQMGAEDVIGGLSRSLGQLNLALRGAWETRPAGDDTTEKMLRDALAMAEDLEREVKNILEEQAGALPEESEER